MNPVELQNNEFLRQFETSVNGSLARIEYAEQERKIFLTKLVIPEMLTMSNLRRISLRVFWNLFQKKT